MGFRYLEIFTLYFCRMCNSNPQIYLHELILILAPVQLHFSNLRQCHSTNLFPRWNQKEEQDNFPNFGTWKFCSHI